jgi:hypothetical protein
MNTPKSNPNTSTSQPENPPADASRAGPKATAANNLPAAILQFGLQYDVPVPLEYFDAVISRSGAFLARAEGRLHLDQVRSRAAVKPSELARYLRNEPRVIPTQN